MILEAADPAAPFQCVPDLRGSEDSSAVLPRVTIKAESQDTPELFTAQVYNVQIEARAVAMATDPLSSFQLTAMAAAVDAVFDRCGLASEMSNAAFRAYGAVPGGRSQDREENRIAYIRTITIPAKLR